MKTDVLVIAPERVDAILRDDKALAETVRLIEKETSSFAPDVTTKKGRDEIISLAYKVRRTKAPVEEKGKELKADAQKFINEVNKRIRMFKNSMGDLSGNIRAPVDEWQAAEGRRIDAIKEQIAAIENMQAARTSETVRAQMDELAARNLGDNVFQEFVKEAEAARAATLKRLAEHAKLLEEQEAERERIERERAELERLRKEKEEVERMKRELEDEKAKMREKAAQKADKAPPTQPSAKEPSAPLQANSGRVTKDQDMIECVRGIARDFMGVGLPEIYADMAARAIYAEQIRGVRIV